MKLTAWISSFVALLSLSSPALADGVLIVGAPTELSWLTDVQTKIAATGLVPGPVDAFYAKDEIPTADQLARYDGALVFSDYPFKDAEALGNLLADMVDQGKGVIQMTFAMYSTAGLGVSGRFRAQSMDVWAPGSQSSPGNLTLGALAEPNHEILNGVRTFNGGIGFYNTVGAIRTGAQLIASWSNGAPLVAVDATTRPGRIVGLNFYPPSSTVRDDFWKTESDGAILMANAINFATAAIRHRHSCVVKNMKLRCWGTNGKGQLGLGHVLPIGDEPNETGTNVPTVDLGDFPVEKVATGGENTCALSRGRVKCFGRNDLGQLGQGDVEARGDGPNEMGDALRAIDLGTGVTAKDIALGNAHACVITHTDQLKCFGSNKVGQLGYGDTVNRGIGADMGDQLPFVDLGNGARVRQVALGERHTCVLLQDNKVKCFGQGSSGRLGNGAIADVGGAQGQMGEALPAVDLGTTELVTKLTAGRDFNCVQFQSGAVKCFGSNTFGQLGLGDTRVRGDTSATMGANLLALDFGSNQVATSLACGTSSCCVTLVQGSLKCWGVNYSGQLGAGDTLARGGRATDMGDDLPQITLDRLTKVRAVSIKDDFLCADDERGTKCWGSNRDGTLGYGDKLDRGNTPGTVPRLLPYLPSAF